MPKSKFTNFQKIADSPESALRIKGFAESQGIQVEEGKPLQISDVVLLPEGPCLIDYVEDGENGPVVGSGLLIEIDSNWVRQGEGGAISFAVPSYGLKQFASKLRLLADQCAKLDSRISLEEGLTSIEDF